MDFRIILCIVCFIWNGLLMAMEERTLHEWCQYAYQEQSKIKNLKHKSDIELITYDKKIHTYIKHVKKFMSTHNIKSVDNTLLPLYTCKLEALLYLYRKKRTPKYEEAVLSEIQSIATIKVRSRSSNYLDDPDYAHIVAKITELYKSFGGPGYESCKHELHKLYTRGNIPLQGKYNAHVEKEMAKKLYLLYKGVNEEKSLKYKAELRRLTRLHKHTHSSQEVTREKISEPQYSSSLPKKLVIIEGYSGQKILQKNKKKPAKQKEIKKTEQTEPALHYSFCVTTLSGKKYSF